MTTTFRTDSTPFTSAFNVTPGTVYHLLDTYGAVALSVVAGFVAANRSVNPTVKTSVIADRFKRTAKHRGLSYIVAEYGSTPYTTDDESTARTLPGVWSRSRAGFVNLVCIPLTLRNFANAIDPANAPGTLTGLLAVARESIIARGYDHLRDHEPTADQIAIVSRLAPALAVGTVPTTDEPTGTIITTDVTTVATTDDPTTDDTRTVAQLRDALTTAGVDIPRKSNRVTLLALAARAGV